MSYRVQFRENARRSWNKLGATVRAQFEKVLRRRAENPHVPVARVHGYVNTYKIKLKGAGYRLAYRVLDDVLVIVVIGIGRRDEGYENLLRFGSDDLSDLD